MNTLLKRIYGKELVDTTYSNTLSSVAFAGTIVGMLVFGYVSDRISRKFGMVSVLLSCPSPRRGSGSMTVPWISASNGYVMDGETPLKCETL